MIHRKPQPSRQQQQIRQCAKSSSSVEFFNVLTGPELLEITESQLPPHRERLYPPTVTLAMFLKQVLDEDGSCQQAVNGWAMQRLAEGLSPRSVATGAYCRARQRLPLPMITALARCSGALLSLGARPEWLWRGRSVKLVDGTGISMPDTADNQRRYPQPGSQAAGVGFPVARVVGVICLATGALLDAAVGPLEGKGHTEWDLFRGLLGVFERGDLMLADALYANYFLVSQLQAQGVDVLLEQHGSRHTDFRRGRRLGPRDHVVEWKKPRQRPQWMTPQAYAAAPESVAMREIAVDGRVLVTTLHDPHGQIHKRELSDLYARRWHVELDLRNIKTTMGMDVLRCKTPSMVDKELWIGLLAYNLIRLMMAQAAAVSGLHPRQLSFKHAVQMWTQWLSHGARRSQFPPGELFRLIAQRRVGHRPGRIEPRTCKRRPKSSKWLKVPRPVARQQIREYGRML